MNSEVKLHFLLIRMGQVVSKICFDDEDGVKNYPIGKGITKDLKGQVAGVKKAESKGSQNKGDVCDVCEANSHTDDHFLDQLPTKEAQADHTVNQINHKLNNNKPCKLIQKSKSEAALAENLVVRDRNHKFSEEDFVFSNLLGTGGFGKVYRAHKKSNPSEVYAIKVISKQSLKNKETTPILTELKILSIISTGKISPFLTQLHYSFQSNLNLYFCLEYVRGGTLKKYARQFKSFPIHIVRYVAAEVLLGLNYLHEKLDIIHRDLKMENILITEEGRCKLTDFGLSRVGKIGAYSFCGTYNYIAPELIRQHGYDKMVDFWAFGNLIYEMAVGNPPFDHKNKKTLFDMINAGCFKLNKIEDPDTRNLVSKLLVLNPETRLGANGIEEIKNHPFFKNTDFNKIAKQEVPSPLKPLVTITVDDDIARISRTPQKSFDMSFKVENFTWRKPSDMIDPCQDDDDEGLYY